MSVMPLTHAEADRIAAVVRHQGFDVTAEEVQAFAGDATLPPSTIGDDYDAAREAALLDALDIDVTPIDYGPRR